MNEENIMVIDAAWPVKLQTPDEKYDEMVRDALNLRDFTFINVMDEDQLREFATDLVTAVLKSSEMTIRSAESYGCIEDYVEEWAEREMDNHD